MEAKKANIIMSLEAEITQTLIQKRMMAMIETPVFIIKPFPIMVLALFEPLDNSRTNMGFIHKVSVREIKNKKIAKNDNFPNPTCPKYLAKEIEINRLNVMLIASLNIITVVFLITLRIIFISMMCLWTLPFLNILWAIPKCKPL